MKRSLEELETTIIPFIIRCVIFWNLTLKLFVINYRKNSKSKKLMLSPFLLFVKLSQAVYYSHCNFYFSIPLFEAVVITAVHWSSALTAGIIFCNNFGHHWWLFFFVKYWMIVNNKSQNNLLQIWLIHNYNFWMTHAVECLWYSLMSVPHCPILFHWCLCKSYKLKQN